MNLSTPTQASRVIEGRSHTAQAVEPTAAVMDTERCTRNDDMVLAEQDDEECVAIEDGCSSSYLDECKTPEQQQEGPPKFTSQAQTQSVDDPPLFKPRSSLLHHHYRSWNTPIDQESEMEPPTLLSVQDAPLFPDSPTLSNTLRIPISATPSMFANSSFSSSSVQRSQRGQVSTTCISNDAAEQHLSTKSTSLPRSVLLSFQDCHFVRLPPRLSKSDAGCLRDITWRIHMAASSASGASGATPNHVSTPPATSSPNPKKIRTNHYMNNDDMPLLTPVEGYTIPKAPYASFFSQDTTTTTTTTSHHHRHGGDPSDMQNEDRKGGVTISRKDSHCSNTDIGVQTSYWNSLPTNTEGSSGTGNSSRVATPLPLLDLDDDDDSESVSSSNAGDGQDKSSRATEVAASLNLSSTTTTTTTTPSGHPTTNRMFPIKQPKLKMRTNHPLLLQSSGFASLLHSQGNTSPTL
jgi:hypothetical protein